MLEAIESSAICVDIEGLIDNIAKNKPNVQYVKPLSQIQLASERYLTGAREANVIVNKALVRCYEYEFNSKLAGSVNLPGNSAFYAVRSFLEQLFIKKMRTDFIDEAVINSVPKEPGKFLSWLKKTIRHHPAFNHAFYNSFLRNQANKKQIKFYLAQESTLDPRFDDLLALMQIGLPAKIKLEIASNYWDEMGCGNFSEIHNSMFARVLSTFAIDKDFIQRNMLLSALISANLSSYLTIYRQNIYQAIGYFGTTEYMVPSRFKHFIAGVERLNMQQAIDYHYLHVTIDAKHANGWFRNAIMPAVTDNYDYAKDIARGVLLRLNSSQLYLDELSAVLTNT